MTKHYLYNLADYLAKDHYLEEVTLEKLAEDWFTTSVDVQHDPGDILAQDRLNDLVSEFHLRCNTAPQYYYRTRRGTPQYLRSVDDAREVLRKEHPKVYAAAQERQSVYASKLRSARNYADAQQETWQSFHQVSQRVVDQTAETLRRKQLSSPSIVPSDDPDDSDCSPTSPSDVREA
jgi:hypothetical protein